MIELFIALFAGLFFGIITGLIPGIHVNLISIILLNLSLYFLGFTSPLILITFIIAMAITHTFLDTIPSIYLGAPDSQSALSVLPGHKMLLKGHGHEAVLLTVIGSYFALLLGILTLPIIGFIFQHSYELIKSYIGFILLAIVIFMIFKENKKLFTLFYFLTAGTFGFLVLNLNMEQPLFPLLSGLFGTSTLLLAINRKVKLPQQKIKKFIGISKKRTFKASFLSLFSGSLVALLPGLGSAQAGVLSNELSGNLGDKGFLVLIGGINTINMLVSLITFYLLDKTRNGAVVVVKEIIHQITIRHLIILLLSCLLAGSLATLLAITISKRFAHLITKINYRLLCLLIITFITLLTFVMTGFLGLFILAASTFLGLIPPLFNIKRSHSMAVLILPVMLWFLI